VCTVLRNIRFEYSALSSPLNPPLAEIKQVHITIIHFMQSCYTAACLYAKKVI